MPELRVLNKNELAFSFTGWANVTLDQRREIAKLQYQANLKAFVEWGEELCPHNMERNLSRVNSRCAACWQSLKQLVEQEVEKSGK